MPSPHSSVIYVEPNMEPIKSGWTPMNEDGRFLDTFERSPRLEDYCIAMNIEVEVCGRDNGEDNTQEISKVLILQWNNPTGENGKKDYINFLSGTKIGGTHGAENLKREPNLSTESTYDALTTYYADMYAGDLINYGTTEMVGIKSVNIQYEKSCVPIISIVFTDVRGMSIFQPQELNRDNSYNGIKGISKDNVAQSFFQCFFKMPLPKFTIYIKGFYGRPVAYEVMCDKFETSFNSETGDFEVNTRFIGYGYSFLTDVSIDALIAAPYADYEGKKYWEQAIEDGRFKIWNKEHSAKVNMPTLCEIITRYNEISIDGEPESGASTLNFEEGNHELELEELTNIRDQYTKWYDKLYEALSALYNRNGEQRCFDVRESGKDGDYMYLVLLADFDASSNLSDVYANGLKDFHELNEETFNIIQTYNAKDNKYKTLENVSLDFTYFEKYKILKPLESVEYSDENEKGTIVKNVKLKSPELYGNYKSKTELKNRLFNYYERDESGNTIGENNYDTTVKTIYQNGQENKQLIYAYFIDIRYTDLKDRINALIAEKNKTQAEKDEEKRLAEINRKLLARLEFYPTIENFTRVMMAHLETFMHMMYAVAADIRNEKRTTKSLGIIGGDDGNIPDVNNNNMYVPPFPRVTERKYGDDNIGRDEDAWIGKFNDGEGFREVDIIDGLFNGIDHVFEAIKVSQTIKEENENNDQPQQQGQTVAAYQLPYPITPYDFFLNSSPYGTDAEVLNDINAFIGRVAIRMFDVLSISPYRKFGVLSDSSEEVARVARVEAANFNKTTTIKNKTLLEAIGTSAESSPLKPELIRGIIFNNVSGYGDVPWGKSRKILSDRGNGLVWMDAYRVDKKDDKGKTEEIRAFYPIQGGTFSELETNFGYFNQSGKNTLNGESVSVSNFSAYYPSLTKADFDAFMENGNNNGFNNVYFTEGREYLTKLLESAGTDDTAGNYSTILENIKKQAELPSYSVFLDGGVIREKHKILKKRTANGVPSNYNKNVLEGKGRSLVVYYNGNPATVVETPSGNQEAVYSECASDFYGSDNFENYFISEFRGIVNNGVFNPAYDTTSNFSWDLNDFTASSFANNQKKLAFGLISIDSIDYTNVRDYINGDHIFVYLPRIAVLQLGAVIYQCISDDDTVMIENIGDTKELMAKINYFNIIKHVPLPTKAEDFIRIIRAMSPLTRIAYAKYFYDWTKTSSAVELRNILNNLQVSRTLGILPAIYMAIYTDKDKNTVVRGLLDENNESVNTVTRHLLETVIVTKGSVNYDRGVTSTTDRIKFNKDWVDTYFTAFLDELRVQHGFKERDVVDNNGVLKKSKPSPKTTDEMKMELYRYLKLLYDKWIPTNPEAAWGMETFFDKGKDEEIRKLNGGGHLFHFIDSYYNKIGHKLLINVGKLANRLTQILASNDVNVMMLGFMADIYSENKCMMMCIQNFFDMSVPENMLDMFKPIPYNDMPAPNKHPDFVVVYPYEPSKNLDIGNSEFKDDGFMLNDEDYTPISVKSRDYDGDDGPCYRMPAFGVSYGKQYQNYFKKVDVNMSSPIATQQSIGAKHAILRQSKDKNEKGTQGQDMFDIYASQSYTCTVTMMGCAWIQPMMYFVLTNVPMFKGSYMIMKVTHSISPGVMETQFTGCRMARTSNKLVENVFTDDYEGTSSDTSLDTKKNLFANVDNNCPYKVYNLFEAESVSDGISDKASFEWLVKTIKKAEGGYVGNIDGKICTMKGVTLETFRHKFGSNKTCNDLKNITDEQWMTIFKQEYWDFWQADKINNKSIACLLVDWVWGSYTYGIYYPEDVLGVPRSVKKAGVAAAVAAINSYGNQEELYNKLWNKRKWHFESLAKQTSKAKFLKGWLNRLNMFSYSGGTQAPTTTVSTKPAKVSDSDLQTEFMRCLQLSVDSTQNGRVVLTSETSTVDNKNFLKIKQQNGARDKLPLVFDIILNGYYDYVQEVWWVYKKGEETKDPLMISVVLSMKPDPNNRHVYFVDGENVKERLSTYYTSPDGLNKNFTNSIKKKYGTGPANPKELEQISDNYNQVTKDVALTNCDDLIAPAVNSDSGIGANAGPGVGGELLPSMMIDNWDAGKAANFLVNHGLSSSIHICAFAVQQGVIAGGIECPSGSGYYKAKALLDSGHWEKLYEGPSSDPWWSSYKPAVGDIVGMQKRNIPLHPSRTDNNAHVGHVAMFCGTKNGWYSDYKQRDKGLGISWLCYEYSNKALAVRYKGGAKSVTQKPLICKERGKCLRSG